MIRGETILSGARMKCSDCGTIPNFGIYKSAAGHYVGTQCNCGPYSRESGYYATAALAAVALDSGDYGR